MPFFPPIIVQEARSIVASTAGERFALLVVVLAEAISPPGFAL